MEHRGLRVQFSKGWQMGVRTVAVKGNLQPRGAGRKLTDGTVVRGLDDIAEKVQIMCESSPVNSSRSGGRSALFEEVVIVCGS